MRMAYKGGADALNTATLPIPTPHAIALMICERGWDGEEKAAENRTEWDSPTPTIRTGRTWDE